MEELNIVHLASEAGFIEAFWEHLWKARVANPLATQREVFEYLNNYYEEKVGEPRYPSFDAFRVRRDRRLQKKLQK